MKLWLPGQCGTDVKIDMDQWKRTESPAANAYMHGQLSSDKDANVLLGRGL